MALGEGDPSRLGPYELVDRLGEGGQGIVYLGRGPAGEQVAVKLLHTRFAADQEARHRFLREVALAQRVARFCTAPVLYADLVGNQPYIVSEYVPGPSLRQLVDREGPRRGAALERLAISTATALAAIHRAGITHRDFKPANVLMGPEGPVVIDFGVARALDSPQATATGATMGTPSYLAPELLSGGEATGAADVFAWGVTMVFAATGTPAFGADSIPSVITRILNIEPDLSTLGPPLHDLVAACLSKNPALRPSADDVVAALTGRPTAAPVQAGPTAATTQAGPAAPPSAASPRQAAPAPAPGPASAPSRPARKAGRRRPSLPILAGVGGAVAVAAIVGATVVTNRTTENMSSEQPGTPAAQASGSTPAGPAHQVIPPPARPRTAPPSSPTTSPATSPSGSLTAQPTHRRTALPTGLPDPARSPVGGRTATPAPSASLSPPSNPTPSAVVIPPESESASSPAATKTAAPAPTKSATQAPAPTKTAAPPPKPNPYTATGVCGAGFGVVASHSWGGKATTYLLYNASTGKNCVITMSKYVVPGKIKMGAVLKVKNGASASDWGSYTTYAGPLRLSAKATCVSWGGGYGAATWTSGWEHCG
ncbi:serine/threonine protein kinase [Microtetraspora sp. NBRC 16547]|uniref:serine/threonine-protein kinase n=1 Tax=Microtetraspora sp. NBRC 16547 TaxID=3030993 RepID=UPI0024A38F43|nr:serine/threonine protein kinase [Microtetraspora sp. NBRC 16547]GLW96842.1 hypothetical protein Misp02_09290 [Microtetraspora sp. NBRC 16547]